MANARVRLVSALPPAKTAQYNWREIRDTLKEHPNQWALIERSSGANTATAARSVVSRVRRGDIAIISPSEFEVTARGNEVYIRYVGKE